MDPKFKNDKHFEERIVQALIVDHRWAEQMIEVLDLNYFNIEYLKELTGIYFDYYKKESAFPSFNLLKTITNDLDNKVLKSQLDEYFKKIAREPMNGDLGYIKETSLDFCKRRSLAMALEKSLDLIEKKKYEQIMPEVQKALMAGSDRDVGHIFLEQLDKRMESVKRNPIPTPWEEMNKIMNGGLSGGELGVIMAGTGVGKSQTLVDMGQHQAKQGYNVAHYTFELGDIYVGKRYDARISGIPFDNLLDNVDRVKESLGEIKGNIVIKGFPVKSVTVLGIKNHIQQLVLRDMRPDIILIDSADLMKSTRTYKDKRLEEESIYEDVRALAQELDIPIWTVTQSNREGLDLDVITLKNVAECIGKAFIADFFVTMTRQKENTFVTVGNFFIAKSRIGLDGMRFPILVTTALSKIEVLSAEEAGNIGDNEALNSTEILKERFQNYLKNGGPMGDVN